MTPAQDAVAAPRLSEAFQERLIREFWNPDNGGQWPRITDAVLASPEFAQILAARLAPIEALAEEWEREIRTSMGELGMKHTHHRDWPRLTKLRAALRTTTNPERNPS